MRITAITTSLCGISAQKIAENFISVWAEKRPEDQLDYLLAPTDLPGFGSGLSEIYSVLFADYAHCLSQPKDEIKVEYFAKAKTILIDLSTSYSISSQLTSLPTESTASLGKALRELLGWVQDGKNLSVETKLPANLRAGLKSRQVQIHLHLPRLSTHSDLGLGMLAEFLGCAEAADENELLTQLQQFHQALSELEIRVTYSEEQALLGLSGMAYAWTFLGLDRQVAQDFERKIGGFATKLSKFELTPQLKLHSTSSVGDFSDSGKVKISGVAGGLGAVFQDPRYRPVLLGDFLLGIPQYQQKVTALSEADLLLFITDDVQQISPRIFQIISDLALDAGVPLVLLSSRNTLRRGELGKLGLAGVHQIFSHPVLSDSSIPLVRTGVELVEEKFLDVFFTQYRSSLERVLHTWTWEFPG
ncbi:MAG: hypothetical protein SPG61_02110 [Arcanobacterium sp.]|nr:hypothetical protein [Arcanobacterium sp.]